MKNLKKSSKIILISFFAFIVFVGIPLMCYIGYQSYRAYLLITEANKIGEQDLVVDQVDMKIYTKGQYAIVEKTFKNYLNEYSNVAKDINTLLEDERIITALSIGNYQEDGPKFEKTQKFLKEYKEISAELFEKMIAMSTTEAIMQKIDVENVSKLMRTLYEWMMFDDQVVQEITEARVELEEAYDTFKKLINIEEKVIKVLADHPEEWYIQGDQLYIESDELYDEYNQLLNEFEE